MTTKNYWVLLTVMHVSSNKKNRQAMKGLKKILMVLMLALPLAAAGVYLFKTLDIKDGLTSSQINCGLEHLPDSTAMTAILSNTSKVTHKTGLPCLTVILSACRRPLTAIFGYRHQQAIASIIPKRRPLSAT